LIAPMVFSNVYSSPSQLKVKTINLIFVVSPLSMQHWDQKLVRSEST